jgi:hypothetical protein
LDAAQGALFDAEPPLVVDEPGICPATLAFDLKSGKYQGGFSLSVQSAGRTDKVSNTTSTTRQTTGVTGRRRTVTTKTVSESYVNSDEAQLRSDLAEAIDAGIEKYLPSAKFID